MIIRINTSFWFLMDLRLLQADSQRNEMLTVGSEGVFPVLLLTLFMRFFLFFPQHPHPHFLSSFALVHTKNIHFLHSPSTMLHHLVTSADKWGQEAISSTSFHSTKTGENDKCLANHKVLSCKLKKVQSRAIWQSLFPPSESLSHFKISLCFPSKIGNPRAMGWETSIG